MVGPISQMRETEAQRGKLAFPCEGRGAGIRPQEYLLQRPHLLVVCLPCFSTTHYREVDEGWMAVDGGSISADGTREGFSSPASAESFPYYKELKAKTKL